MGVHQPGDDQAAGRVDYLRLGRRGLQIPADGGDHAVGDQDVAAGQVAQIRVHGDHVAPLDQQFFRHDGLAFLLREFGKLSCLSACPRPAGAVQYLISPV